VGKIKEGYQRSDIGDQEASEVNDVKEVKEKRKARGWVMGCDGAAIPPLRLANDASLRSG